jgi:hypothetical protein
MEYRDIEYTLVQGIGRRLWKWSATVSGVKISGQGSTRDEAIADAEKAIDRALTPKKRRLERKHFGMAIHSYKRTALLTPWLKRDPQTPNECLICLNIDMAPSVYRP